MTYDYAREIADARDHSTYDEPTIDREEQEWLETQSRKHAEHMAGCDGCAGWWHGGAG